ncbi:M48 family metallopeptidase [Paraflavisolibacter sp. H34]|uniref:M48 family metallopeptidase n=1 Tax=Huijunlia imazamoxiresistens TaxID=3127457 RepID=UPI0030160984
MEQPETIRYFDGNSARPRPVRVLFFNDLVCLYEEEGQHLLDCFPPAGMSHHRVGGACYVYLDAKKLKYLQLPAETPLAAELAEKVEAANPHPSDWLMKQKLVLLVPVMVALAVGLYFLLVTLIPFLGSRMIGVQQEMVLGDKLHEAMLQEARLLGATVDEAGTRKLQAFADRLELSSHYPIRLTLVNSGIVNAYALPGGQVVVYRGILDKIKSPEALAALLAHESTHVNERHSLRSLLRNAANGILVSVVFNDLSGVSGALVTNADALYGLRYSRSLETEADQKGMDLMRKNGVDVGGMNELMLALKEVGDLPGRLSFLSTHPLTQDRITAADRYRKSHPTPTGARRDLDSLFKALKQK